MSIKRYPEEFKIEAVKQVTEAGYSAYDVAERLGTTTNSLYNWIRKYGPQSSDYQKASQESDEIRRLKKELKRVTDERDLLKKAAVDTPLLKSTWGTSRFDRSAGCSIFTRAVITHGCVSLSLLVSVKMTSFLG